MGTSAELPETLPVHSAPSDIWEQPVPQVYTWLPETRRQRPGGCIFSGVLFLPQGPTLEARHTPPPESLHGIGID